MGYFTFSNEFFYLFIWDYIVVELHLQPKIIPYSFHLLYYSAKI